MIELHERLSEFSYGYGVIRETEMLLEQIGIRAVPFLPSLIQEADLGFDVAFDRPGAALMLQFKLGQSLRKFYRNGPSEPAPELDRPFWRFSIDTAEPDGQFETLLKAEQDGAEAYYAAPRFSDWPHYARLFEQREVLDNSALVRPSEIRAGLDSKGAPDGFHRIVYDRYRVHMCSKPTRIPETGGDDAVEMLAAIVREKRQPARVVLERVLKGFDDRSSIRRETVNDAYYERPRSMGDIGYRATSEYARAQRARRLTKLLNQARSRDHAVAAAVGVELWTLGIQLVVAVEGR
jgi:hypothetical protein